MPVEQVVCVPAKRGARPVRLSVVRNGLCAVRVTDHPDPQVHAGHSLHCAPARELGAALKIGGSARVPTLEGRVLVLEGIRLGDEAVWHQAWTLDEQQRPALGEALIATADAVSSGS